MRFAFGRSYRCGDFASTVGLPVTLFILSAPRPRIVVTRRRETSLKNVKRRVSHNIVVDSALGVSLVPRINTLFRCPWLEIRGGVFSVGHYMLR